MSKIICDVCGTAYPDTASQCPICGTAKSEAAVPAAGDSGHAYVRGGRFSTANVRRRTGGRQEPRRAAARPPRRTDASERKAVQSNQEESSGNNRWLVIIAIILVLGIIAVCTFIAAKFIDGFGGFGPQGSTPGATQSDPTSSSSHITPGRIPCETLDISVKEHIFRQVGETLLLEPAFQPTNTTDVIKYSSSDTNVAAVDPNGKVTAVGKGQAVITITCGEKVVACSITCEIEETPPKPPVTLELNRQDFSLNGYGASHNLYSGELDPKLITWTSDNPEVATVTDGKVVAVGNGVTHVHAEYEGQKVSCIVRCNNVEKPVDTKYKLRTQYGDAADITIKVGDSVTLQLVDQETGLRVPAADLKFSVAKEGYVTVDEKGRVVGVSTNYGGVYVYVEYEGVTYKCLVRITKK